MRHVSALLFTEEHFFIVWLYRTLFIHPSTSIRVVCLLWIVLLWRFTCKFFCRGVFISLGQIGRSRTDEPYGNSVLTFWGTAKLFLKVAAPYYIPARNIRGSDLSTFLSTLVTVHLFFFFFYCSRLSWRELVFHCGFDLISLKTNDWTSFVCIGHLCLEKRLFKSFARF